MEYLPTGAFEADISRIDPDLAWALGFRSGDRGTHTSRTMMLEELTQLLAVVPGEVPRTDYVQAALAENCLGKRTLATRKLSLQRLTELYGLEERLPLFRVMRKLWSSYEGCRPLLALLLAMTRDPLLRATARSVLATPAGHEFSRQLMRDELVEMAAGRLNEATLDAVLRNALSSWTQSGHMSGHSRKRRQNAAAGPASATYSLLLGYVLGRRGWLLLESPWSAILDRGKNDRIDLAVEAKRLGLLDLKQAGRVIELSFPALLSAKERDLTYGVHRETG